jgi:signal transduction histidine kinase
MLRRRLFLQIYATIIAALVTVVVLSALLWHVFGRDRFNQHVLEVSGRLIQKVLPPAGASLNEQRRAVQQLGRELDIDLGLFRPDGELIASTSDEILWHGRHVRPGWQGGRRGHGWGLRLPDDRWIVIDLDRRGRRRPLLGLILFLSIIALGVAAVAYPFVRRLTGRLERLQIGVDKIGSGDLSVRVNVEGRDEVAALATSFNNAASKIETLVASHKLLLANASHELRTPLSRIRLGIELLQSGGDDETRKAALQHDIAELDTLIDEILLMSRLDDAAHLDLNEDVDLVGLIAEECARYEDCTFSGTAPPIKGDARLLKRLVRNLLENAGKHGVLPATVTIGATHDHVVLLFTDRGAGIDEAEREIVFQTFYRRPGKQNLRGYGLGLALVRQIAEAHGGTAAVVTTSPTATGFEIRLPLQQGSTD